jgi:F-type H+-transporting ATPase subunit b
MCPTDLGKQSAVSTRVYWLLAALAFLASGAIASAQAQEEKSAAKDAAHAPAAAHAPDAGHAEKAGKQDAAHGEAGHAAAGHGHDETDLGHGNATAAMTNPADLKFDLSIYTFLVFLILLAVLYKFAWGPIATALEQREETIARQIADAKLASDRAAQQLKEYEARLAKATDEARQIVAHARKDAEVAKDKIVAEARDAAQKERDRAVADITVAKNQALDQIAQKSVQTAVALASNIIRREVKPQEHEALIGDAIKEFSKLN